MAIRYRAFFGLLTLLLLLPQTVLAGKSTIENDQLHIPRIDLDGLGPSEITFRVDFQNDYLFILSAVAQADTNIANSGAFDPQTAVLELDEIELTSGEKYSAQLSLLSQDGDIIFKLDDAVLLNPQDPNGEFSDETVALYSQQCGSCHGTAGEGVSAPALIQCSRCGDNALLAEYIANTMPLGQSSICDTTCAATLADYIANGLNEDNEQIANDTIGFIEVLRLGENIRKVSSQLVSRLPKLPEFQLVSSQGEEGLRSAIELMMDDEAFYDRLGEIFNDYFLTDKYHSSNGSEAAVNLLDSNDFPNKKWYDPDSSNRSEEYGELRRETNDAIAREPLELINYIVRNNRPFTELVTADYMMVNPYSAVSYGVSDRVSFQNANDLDEFVAVQVDDLPHAGILTSPMFLNRYPTTNTNRNRGRSRVVFDLFLDTDILAIEGVRPGNAVDITTPIPTINNPECSKCHTVLDPVASVFQNWDYKGRFRPARLENGWHTDMEPRGFNGQLMPLAGNVDSSVQWLGQQIAADPRFPRAVVRIVVNGLTGKEPLTAPGEGAPQSEIDGYVAERAILNDIQDLFVADNYNLKTLIREVLMSPYYRANGLIEDASELAHANTGSYALLTPEQLDRKISSLLKFEWRRNMDSYYKDIDSSWASQLREQYHQIYGGIDSDTITTRLRNPNGMMGSMQIRMANELACYAVPQDFLRAEGSRRLFPFVDRQLSPYNESGVIDETNMGLIRENIRYLHTFLLAEELPLGSEEHVITENLFMATINKGRQRILNSGGDWRDVNISGHCDRQRDLQGNELDDDEEIREDRQYIVRSWMAVLAYLFADYRFVYE